jgi:hypothetical protein
MRFHEPSKYIFLSAIFLLLVCSSWNLAIAGDIRDELPAEPSGKVLPSEKFVGKVALGYKAAQTIPGICSKLFCYCGCDLTDKHNSLLDCFTCIHGMDCDICLDEAIVALHLKEEGKSITEIQKIIDDEFSLQYPWDKPSPTLLKYRETYRLPLNKSAGSANANLGHKKSGKCCAHKSTKS